MCPRPRAFSRTSRIGGSLGGARLPLVRSSGASHPPSAATCAAWRRRRLPAFIRSACQRASSRS
eukprot:8013388-Alexandrium_andersonii.AAC.1